MKAEEEGSRKSSTCQPGSVSMRYSDMLLVEYEPFSLVELFSSKLYVPYGNGFSIEEELDISLETVRGRFMVENGVLEEAVMAASELVVVEEVDGFLYKLNEAESFTPVRRNLLCF